MNKFLITFLIIFLSLNMRAQTDDKFQEFGSYIFDSVKENDTLKLISQVPSKDELFRYMNLFSAENQTKQDFIKEINETYEDGIIKFSESLIKTRNKGLEAGIVWQSSKYENTTIDKQPNFDGKEIDAYDITIKFSYYTVTYMLKTKCIVLENKIYIVHKIKLYPI